MFEDLRKRVSPLDDMPRDFSPEDRRELAKIRAARLGIVEDPPAVPMHFSDRRKAAGDVIVKMIGATAAGSTAFARPPWTLRRRDYRPPYTPAPVDKAERLAARGCQHAAAPFRMTKGDAVDPSPTPGTRRAITTGDMTLDGTIRAADYAAGNYQRDSYGRVNARSEQEAAYIRGLSGSDRARLVAEVLGRVNPNPVVEIKSGFEAPDHAGYADDDVSGFRGLDGRSPRDTSPTNIGADGAKFSKFHQDKYSNDDGSPNLSALAQHGARRAAKAAILAEVAKVDALGHRVDVLAQRLKRRMR
jgi:hypothetical protein